MYEQRQAKGCLKKFPLKKTWELLNLSRNQLWIMRGLLLGHSHIKGHLFKLGLVNSPVCDGCKQAYEMASHMLCCCEALVTFRFRHLGCYFMKPDDFEDISLSKMLHFVQDVMLLNGCANGLHIMSIPVKVHGSLQCLSFCILFYSILFYSILFYFSSYNYITILIMLEIMQFVNLINNFS